MNCFMVCSPQVQVKLTTYDRPKSADIHLQSTTKERALIYTHQYGKAYSQWRAFLLHNRWLPGKIEEVAKKGQSPWHCMYGIQTQQFIRYGRLSGIKR
jgi:hypothetical protein